MRNNYFINEQNTVLLKLNSEKPKQFQINPFDFNFNAEMVKSGFAKSGSLIFEVTERCNLNCSYCTYSNLYTHHLERNKTELTFKKAKNLMDFYFMLQKYYFNSSSIPVSIGFYGGEPLLNIKLVKKIMEYAKNFANSISFSMTTNGLLLDKYIDILVENDFALLISLDGNESHNEYRLFSTGKPSFKKVYSNLKFISEKCPKYFRYKF